MGICSRRRVRFFRFSSLASLAPCPVEPLSCLFVIGVYSQRFCEIRTGCVFLPYEQIEISTTQNVHLVNINTSAIQAEEHSFVLNSAISDQAHLRVFLVTFAVVAETHIVQGHMVRSRLRDGIAVELQGSIIVPSRIEAAAQLEGNISLVLHVVVVFVYFVQAKTHIFLCLLVGAIYLSWETRTLSLTNSLNSTMQSLSLTIT